MTGGIKCLRFTDPEKEAERILKIHDDILAHKLARRTVEYQFNLQICLSFQGVQFIIFSVYHATHNIYNLQASRLSTEELPMN